MVMIMMLKTIKDRLSWVSLFLNRSYGSAFGFWNMLNTHAGLLYLYRLHAVNNDDDDDDDNDHDGDDEDVDIWFRCLGFLPIILAMLLLTLWVVLRSL